MSCKCTSICGTCSAECIKVTAVETTVTAVELQETQVTLASLPVGQKIVLSIDPELLPQSTLPVVLTDGVTTIPLWMENGNVMRENVFLPFCRKVSRCKDNAHIRVRFLADPSHLIVYRHKRY